MFRRKEEVTDSKSTDNAEVENASTAETASPASVFGRSQTATDSTPSEEQTPKPAIKSVFEPASASRTPYAEPRSYRTPAEPVRREDFRQTTNQAAPSQAKPASVAEKAQKRVLTVGQDTVLKGEISTCDRVIVEGGVEAKLSEVQTLDITETGVFRGSAIIDEAHISGMFEGELTVRGKLVVFASGHISGKVRYGEIEIHSGGRVIGDLNLYEGLEPASREETKSRKSSKSSSSSDSAESSERAANGSISELFAN